MEVRRSSVSSKGPFKNRRRFSSSNEDQSMGCISKELEKLLSFSLWLPKASEVLEAFEASVSLKLKRLRLSSEVGKLKQSRKLAVPELRRNLIEPLSDERLFSC